MNMETVDELLKHKLGLREWEFGPVSSGVQEAIDRQIATAAFKKQIPHRAHVDVPTVINVNPLVIGDNRKNGTNNPPLRVRTGRDGRDPICCHTIEIEGPSRIIHDPENPIPAGAHVWIETTAPVKTQ